MKNVIFASLLFATSLFPQSNASAGETCQVIANGAQAVCAKGPVRMINPAGTGTYTCGAYYDFPQRAGDTFLNGQKATRVGEFSQVASNSAMQAVLKINDAERVRVLWEGSNSLLSTITDIAHKHCEAASKKAGVFFDPKKCQAACNGIQL